MVKVQKINTAIQQTKQSYMSEERFWLNYDNKLMYELSNALMNKRDHLTEFAQNNDKFYQTIDGNLKVKPGKSLGLNDLNEEILQDICIHKQLQKQIKNVAKLIRNDLLNFKK